MKNLHSLLSFAGIFVSLGLPGCMQSDKDLTAKVINAGARLASDSEATLSTEGLELQKFVEENVKKDKEENIIAVVGLELMSKSVSFVDEERKTQEHSLNSQIELQEDLKTLVRDDKPIFTYDHQQSDFKVEFSAPKLATGSTFFGLTSYFQDESCQGSEKYFASEPPISTLLEVVKTQEKKCGVHTVTYCFRVSKKDSSEQVYALIKSPTIEVHLPCEDTVFKGASVTVAAGDSGAYEKAKNLNIYAGTLVSAMYITNDSTCAAGGQWEPYAPTKTAWPLAWNQARSEAVFYAKFKGLLFGEVSSCIQGSSKAPAATSLSIAAAAEETSSAKVSLSLGAVNASEMYLTNSADCTTAGVWEPYQETKPEWLLAPANGKTNVYVKFRDARGNTSSCMTDSIGFDNLGPEGARLQVAGGARNTKSAVVSLELAASDAAHMYVSNSPGCAEGGNWEDFATTKADWPLAQSNTLASVYAKFRDAVGNESACVSTSITHDDSPPSGTSLVIQSPRSEDDDSVTAVKAVDLVFAAKEATELFVSNSPDCSGQETWQAFTSKKSGWQLEVAGKTEGKTEAETATVSVRYRDALGNSSGCVTDSIVYDDLPPSKTELSIHPQTRAGESAGDAGYTHSSLVDLKLGAEGAAQMFLSNLADCGGERSWEAYAPVKTGWKLDPSAGKARVGVLYRDAAGNVSDCVSQEILYDNEPPSLLSFSILSQPRDDDDSYTSVKTVTLSLAALGASQMFVTNSPECGGEVSWEGFATEKSWTLEPSAGKARVYVRLRDPAGNTSACLSDEIFYDDTAPTEPSLAIHSKFSEDDDRVTALTQVDLVFSVKDATELFVTNNKDCGGEEKWEALRARKEDWPLEVKDGKADVYVRYRDAARNTTACVSASILYDNEPPSGVSLGIEGLSPGAEPGYTGSRSVALALAANGASQLFVSNSADCQGEPQWLPFTSKIPDWTLVPADDGKASVSVRYRDAAGNASECVAATVFYDDKAPSEPSLAILPLFQDGDPAYTASKSVELVPAATGATQMFLTNNKDCSGQESWEAFAAKKTWTLAPAADGQASVYAQYRDAAGNRSDCVRAGITYDAEAPSGAAVHVQSAFSEDDDSATALASVSLELSVNDATQMAITNSKGCAGPEVWEPVTARKEGWPLEIVAGEATVFVRYRDAAGNTTACVSDSILYDNEPPTGVSVGIEALSAGAEPGYTGSSSVALALAANGAAQLSVSNTADCQGEPQWRPFSSKIPDWTLVPADDGKASVSVRYRDAAGNASECVSASILYDDKAPSGASLAILPLFKDGDPAYTASKSVELVLGVVDATEMFVTNTAECQGEETWEPFAAKKAWTLAPAADGQARVYAQYRDAAGNRSDCVRAGITYDDQAPTGATLVIASQAADDDDSETADTLVDLVLTVNAATQMFLTNEKDCAGEPTWEPLAAKKSNWRLDPRAGLGEVYALYRDGAGNTSACVKDSIVYDNEAPQNLSLRVQSHNASDDDTVTRDALVDLALGAEGATHMQLSNTSDCSGTEAWVAYASSRQDWPLEPQDGKATVSVRYKDAVGNLSACISDEIFFDNESPTAASLRIRSQDPDDDDTVTGSLLVDLELAVTDATEMFLTNQKDCGGAETWQALATTRSNWALEPVAGEGTVFVRYRDAAGNLSSCVSASISYDNEKPTAAHLSLHSQVADDDDTYTSQAVVDLVLGSTGATQMFITNTPECGGKQTWTTFSTSKKSWPIDVIDGKATVYALYRDAAKNLSECVSASILFDDAAPTKPSLVVQSKYSEDDDSYTSTAVVNLVLGAEGATEMFVSNTPDCSGERRWESFATTRSDWPLELISDQAVVSVLYRDAAHNLSDCVRDSILYDAQAPSGVKLTLHSKVADDDDRVTSELVADLKLAASEATEMRLTNSADCSGEGSWEAVAPSKTDWPLSLLAEGKAFVSVRYRDAAGNTSACASASILYDNEAPSGAAVSLRSQTGGQDDSYTSSLTVDLELAVSGAHEMFLSNTPDCSGPESWEPVSPAKSGWLLSVSEGKATVSVRYRDAARNLSACVSDSILYDNEAPSAPKLVIQSQTPEDDDDTYSASATVDLVLGAVGATEMAISNGPSCAEDATWVAFADAQRNWSLAATSDGEAKVSVRYRDAAHNLSDCVSDGILYDQTPPSGASLKILSQIADDDDTVTSVAVVDLQLAATDATELRLTNSADCSGEGSWEPFATSKTDWALSLAEGKAFVSVRYRDAAGNTSACASASILYDNEAPSGAGLVIRSQANDDEAYTASSRVDLTLAAVGATEMFISNNAGCSGTETWLDFATSYKNWPLAVEGGKATVSVRYRDAARNTSACVQDEILYDDTAPTKPSVLIQSKYSEDDDTYTSEAVANLVLGAEGATEMLISNSRDCSGEEGTWVSFSTAQRDWPLEILSGQAVVSVRYRDAAKNLSDCASDSILFDNEPPVSPSLVIHSEDLDDDDSYTALATVNLELAAFGATQMALSNSADCGGERDWQPFVGSLTGWVLNPTAPTVSVLYRDAAGNTTACLSDSIVFDSEAPSAASITLRSQRADDDDTYTAQTLVDLSLKATGASEMFITNSGCEAKPVWVPYQEAKSDWPLDLKDGSATVYARFRDAAKNVSGCVSDAILYYDKVPSNLGLRIESPLTDDDDSYTASLTVTLALEASDATEMFVSNSADCQGAGSWEALTASKGWTLSPAADGTATVSVRYRDIAGNTSACLSDSIVYDNQPPTAAVVQVHSPNPDDDDSYTSSTAVELSLGALGATQMQVSNTPDCQAEEAGWEDFATKKSWTLEPQAGVAKVYVRYRDAARNLSDCVSAAIFFDDQAPTAPSLVIQSAAEDQRYTALKTVNLTPAAVGASHMYLSNAGCETGGSWAAYAGSLAWTLEPSGETAVVYARYKDLAGNLSACVSASILYDAEPPSTPLLSINSLDPGADPSYTTTAAVSLSLSAGGATKMALSNAAGCSGATSWEAYSEAKAWSLILPAAEASAFVSVLFKDAAGNTSACVSDEITYDPPPTLSSLRLSSLTGSNDYTTSLTVNAALVASSDASGLYLSNSPNCEGGTWEAYAATRANWALDAAQNNKTATVSAKVKDSRGSESACVSAQIVHDDLGPSSPTLKINNDDAYTKNKVVTLSLSATDATQMFVTNTVGCGAVGSETWAAYATSLSWTLGKTNSKETVYVRYRDLAGNVSECTKDEITHDDILPSLDSVTIASGATYTNNGSEIVNLVATDATDLGQGFMFISNVAGCATGVNWQPYNYSSSQPMLVQSDGKTVAVYAKVKDAAGNESSCKADTITYDATPPTAPASITAFSASASGVSLTWTAAADAVSGLKGYEVAIGTTDLATDPKTWTAVAALTTPSTTLEGLTLVAETPYYPFVRAIDQAGNVSPITGGPSFSPTPPPIELASGGSFNCALLKNGQVKCWGANGSGRLGQNHTNIVGDNAGEMASLQPIPFKDGRTMKALATGQGEHMCAISTAGEVFCWGSNNNGQLGQGTITIQNITNNDIGWRPEDMQNLNPVNLGTGRTATQVAVSKITCALLDNGTVKCWGVNNGGQLGMGDQTSRTSPPDTAINLGTGRTATKVRAGGDFTCALLDDATLKCWGMNTNAQLGLGSTVGRQLVPGAAIDFGSSLTVKDFDLSVTHGCAVLSDDSVKCWGTDSYGSLGQDISANSTNRKIGDAPGEIASLPAVNLGAGNTASEIKLGNYSSCVLLKGTDAGKLKCWGYNLEGKLGQGSKKNYGNAETGYMMTDLKPINLGTGRTAVKFSPGTNATCALLDNDLLKCWGYGEHGQLGYDTGKSPTIGDGANEMGDKLKNVDL